jgi:DNA-binding NarL/FixJ family response regulator
MERILGGALVTGHRRNPVTQSELLRVVRDQHPDLVIVDIRMPPRHETEGLDAARMIRQELPEVGILVLAAHAEVDEALELLATGRAIGYVLKSRVTKVEDFIAAVDRVIEGGSVVDPAIVQELVNVRHREDRLERSTEREREVLALMAARASNAGIGPCQSHRPVAEARDVDAGELDAIAHGRRMRF